MHFYKQMVGSFMDNIGLPEKLKSHFLPLIGKIIDLKRPSGATWHVKLIRLSEELVFQPGWKDFVSANDVSPNDLLVFKYISGNKFKVLIFDPWGCEKSGYIEKTTSDSSVKLVQSDTCSGSESDGSGMKSEEMEDEMDHSKIAEISETNTPAKKRLIKNPRKRKIANHDVCCEQHGIVIYANVEGCSTGEEMSERDCPLEIEQVASGVKGENPSFVQILKPSSLSIQCGISIPKKFSAEHLPKESQNLVLYCPEKKAAWVVRYFYSPYQQFIRYSGWGKFVHDNNLREGNPCLFVLVKTSQPITFIVRV